MMKRILSLMLSLILLASCAQAEGWLTESHEPGAVDAVTDKTVYDAADSAGTVVNASDPGTPGQQEQIVYSFTPLDVVLVVDVSGSMGRSDSSKDLLDYAKDAASAFSRTLLSINPASRVGVVEFSSAAFVVSSLKGLNDQSALLSAIGGIHLGGNTNTGSGYATAASLLESEAMSGRRRMVLMITDGLANEGEGDPVQYAVSQGRNCAAMGSVYTIGLVGGMGESEKRETRRVLNSGYETRYFEVDFDQVGDAGAMINMLTTSIAVSASSGEVVNEDGSVSEGSTYQLTLEGGYNARVRHASGASLSSYPEDYSDSAPFGTMTNVNGRKHFVLVEDDYTIDLEGASSGPGSFSLSAMHGLEMQEEPLASLGGWSDPSVGRRYVISDGQISSSDTGYNPIDPTDTDRQGNPVTGNPSMADAISKGAAQVKDAPTKKGSKLAQLKKNDHVAVLAQDSAAGYAFVAYTDKDGKLSRGWVETSLLKEIKGFVPEMPTLGGQYAVASDVASRCAPADSASEALALKAGEEATLLHVDRDAQGREWAYVSVTRKKAQRCVYVPADCLQGWTAIAPEGFRMSHAQMENVSELFFPAVNVGMLKLKVYSAPSTKSWRGAKGKAMVATVGGLYACGWVDNGWLLVQYGTSNDTRRVGYVQASELRSAAPILPQITFNAAPATVHTACVLTDDPDTMKEQIVSLKPGAKVTWLATYSYHEGVELDYIQTKVNNKTVRGFIPAGHLDK
ncbi:MAG: VWA domain-containing protein [Clostridia bacterium]|nr:VWA domain-containing protein [Clostridia bacterium]